MKRLDFCLKFQCVGSSEHRTGWLFSALWIRHFGGRTKSTPPSPQKIKKWKRWNSFQPTIENELLNSVSKEKHKGCSYRFDPVASWSDMRLLGRNVDLDRDERVLVSANRFALLFLASKLPCSLLHCFVFSFPEQGSLGHFRIRKDLFLCVLNASWIF